MTLTKNWYTVDEASSKYGIPIQRLQLWVENELVRSEDDKGKTYLINGDDIEIQLNLTPFV